MIHYDTLRDYKFPERADDIRGAELFGRNDEKLGEISDVIFDRSSGEVRYAVVDTGGWLKSEEFLVPVERLELRNDKEDNHYRVNLTTAQIEQFPQYDEKLVSTEKDWYDYEKRYEERSRDTFTEGAVLHQKDSANIVTPADLPAEPGATRQDVDALKARTRDFTPQGLVTGAMNTSATAWGQSMGNVTLRQEREDLAPRSPEEVAEPAKDTKNETEPSFDPREMRTVEGDSIFNNEDLQHLRIDHKNANEDAAYGGMPTEATGSESRAATSPNLVARLGRRWASFQDRLRANRHNVIKYCATREGDRLQNESRQKKDVA